MKYIKLLILVMFVVEIYVHRDKWLPALPHIRWKTNAPEVVEDTGQKKEYEELIGEAPTTENEGGTAASAVLPSGTDAIKDRATQIENDIRVINGDFEDIKSGNE